MGKTRAHSPQTIVLDSGALIAFERGNKLVRALLDEAYGLGRVVLIPAGVVGQVWRNGQLQVDLVRLLKNERTQIVPLDDQTARLCGEFCARARTADVIDASVVVLARMKRARIISGDPKDLKRLDPSADIIAL
jgi:predicted nucleic acid-binding protein